MKAAEKWRLSDARRVISAAGRRAMSLIRQAPRLKPRTPVLSYSIACDEMSFKALQGEWEELFARAAVQMPFLRYSWLELCWNRRRDIRGTSLFIFVARKHDRPVLMAPLVRRGRTLLFLNSRAPQHSDVLVEDSDDAPVYVDYFWKALCRMRSVRYLVSAGIRDDSLLVEHLAKARQVSEGPRLMAAFLDLGKFGDWETYWQNLPPHLRQDHRRRLRNLEKLGAVKFRMADSSSCSNDMAWLFAQKRQQLDRMDKSAKWLGAPATEEFFTAAAIEGIESGRTWLTVLSIDGATIAAKLGFREGSTLYWSKTAFDRAWHRYSPGRTLSLLVIERAFHEGLREIDFGFGAFRWKKPLSTATRTAWYNKVRLSHLET